MQTISLDTNSFDTHQQVANWLCVVLPYSIVDPLDRSKVLNALTGGYHDVSEDGSIGDATKIDGIYVLDGDILNWNTSTSKDSYIGGLNMTLRYGYNDWLQKLSPGDWCLFFAFDDVKSYRSVLARLRNNYTLKIDSEYQDFDVTRNGANKALNDYTSGLKFIGRISSIRRHVGRLATGTYDVRYFVQAHSFTEFNSVLYYNDLLNFAYPKTVQMFGDFGVKIDDLFIKGSRTGNEDGFINNTKLVPTLANIILGTGPGGRSVNQSSSIGDLIKNTPNQKFRIPPILGDMLGFNGTPQDDQAPEPQAQTVTDILTFYVGQQTHDTQSKKDYMKLLPDSGSTSGNVEYSSIPLNDNMILQPLDLKGKSTWAIMQSYANEPINEMFTCLKTDKRNRILPSVILRRTPLASDDFAIGAAKKGYNVKPYSSFPAWILSSNLVLDEDIGRSDAVRFNYVQVIGSDAIYAKDANKTDRLEQVTNPPLAIETDIARNGLRMYVTKVPAQSYARQVSPQQNQGRLYTALMADLLTDKHLKFNGSVMSWLITQPIAEGENLIYNNMLFHIERVQHSGNIAPNGQRIATTQLDLTNGIPLKALANRLPPTISEDEETQLIQQLVLKPIEVENSGKLTELRNNRVDLEDIGVLGATNSQIK